MCTLNFSFHLLTPAFGLLTAGGGLAALSGPPLAGRMSDVSKVGIDHDIDYDQHY